MMMMTISGRNYCTDSMAPQGEQHRWNPISIAEGDQHRSPLWFILILLLRRMGSKCSIERQSAVGKLIDDLLHCLQA